MHLHSCMRHKLPCGLYGLLRKTTGTSGECFLHCWLRAFVRSDFYFATTKWAVFEIYRCQRQIEMSALPGFPLAAKLRIVHCGLIFSTGSEQTCVSPGMIRCWFVPRIVPCHRFIHSRIDRLAICNRCLT